MLEKVIEKQKDLIDNLYEIIKQKSEIIFRQNCKIIFLKTENKNLKVENKRLKHDKR